MKTTTNTKSFISDTITPVGLYLNLRDKFYNSFLLESSDYHSKENAHSFICLKPLANFKVEKNKISITGLNLNEVTQIQNRNQVVNSLQAFINRFDYDGNQINGVFGYTSFDAIKYFEKIDLKEQAKDNEIPILNYNFYKFIIQINHFKNELTIIENIIGTEKSEIESLEKLIRSTAYPQYSFKLKNKQKSNFTDQEFMKIVEKGKEHCQLGDVFQIVLSRQFSQNFSGDDFNVYRALRSINPSPYLFYFDYGSYKLFGSSPEAQIKIENNIATINPIAGTYRRTGNDNEDNKLAEKLSSDPKEIAEHNMLVDLARNDLSKHGKNVTVKTYKEVQYYSHVLHLVSEVTAEVKQNDSIQLFADTFPAGTLSGAPKYKALQLIDSYENINRGFYGGAIGFFGFNGSVNHAITIRSFLSKNNTLFSQAGAGVVIKSDEEKEMQEVKNKLEALQMALKKAEKL